MKGYLFIDYWRAANALSTFWKVRCTLKGTGMQREGEGAESENKSRLKWRENKKKNICEVLAHFLAVFLDSDFLIVLLNRKAKVFHMTLNNFLSSNYVATVLTMLCMVPSLQITVTIWLCVVFWFAFCCISSLLKLWSTARDLYESFIGPLPVGWELEGPAQYVFYLPLWFVSFVLRTMSNTFTSWLYLHNQ